MSEPAPPEHSIEEEPPDLPGIRTWRGLYWFVFFWFVIVVGLLAVFTRAFA